MIFVKKFESFNKNTLMAGVAKSKDRDLSFRLLKYNSCTCCRSCTCCDNIINNKDVLATQFVSPFSKTEGFHNIVRTVDLTHRGLRFRKSFSCNIMCFHRYSSMKAYSICQTLTLVVSALPESRLCEWHRHKDINTVKETRRRNLLCRQTPHLHSSILHVTILEVIYYFGYLGFGSEIKESNSFLEFWQSRPKQLWETTLFKDLLPRLRV